MALHIAYLSILIPTVIAIPTFAHQPRFSANVSTGTLHGTHGTGATAVPYCRCNSTLVGPTGTGRTSRSVVTIASIPASVNVAAEGATSTAVSAVPLFRSSDIPGQPLLNSHGGLKSPIAIFENLDKCGPATITVTEANTVTVTVNAVSATAIPPSASSSHSENPDVGVKSDDESTPARLSTGVIPTGPPPVSDHTHGHKHLSFHHKSATLSINSIAPSAKPEQPEAASSAAALVTVSNLPATAEASSTKVSSNPPYVKPTINLANPVPQEIGSSTPTVVAGLPTPSSSYPVIRSSTPEPKSSAPLVASSFSKPEVKPSNPSAHSVPEVKPSTPSAPTVPESKPSVSSSLSKPEVTPSTSAPSALSVPQSKPSASSSPSKPEVIPLAPPAPSTLESKPVASSTSSKVDLIPLAPSASPTPESKPLTSFAPPEPKSTSSAPSAPSGPTSKPSAPSVPSPPGTKRGLVYNNAALTESFSSSPAISWCYDWTSQPGGTIPSKFNFVPMMWGLKADHISSWKSDADAAIAAGSTHLLGFNEPDLPEQANLDPEAATAAWREYMQPYAGKAKLGSPAVCNGDGTTGLNWLDRFLQTCSGCTIDFIAIHWYGLADNGGVANFKDHVGKAIQAAEGRPVWITEFQPNGSPDQQASWLDQILPWLDDPAQSGVERYSYFQVDGILVNGGGGLTQVGSRYAH